MLAYLAWSALALTHLLTHPHTPLVGIVDSGASDSGVSPVAGTLFYSLWFYSAATGTHMPGLLLFTPAQLVAPRPHRHTSTQNRCLSLRRARNGVEQENRTDCGDWVEGMARLVYQPAYSPSIFPFDWPFIYPMLPLFPHIFSSPNHLIPLFCQSLVPPLNILCNSSVSSNVVTELMGPILFSAFIMWIHQAYFTLKYTTLAAQDYRFLYNIKSLSFVKQIYKQTKQ